MDFLADLFTLQNILIIIAAVLTIILGAVGRKWKPVVEELMDVSDEAKQALDPNSPGGENITEAERQELAKEFVDVIVAVLGALGGPLGRLFSGAVKLIRRLFK